MSAKHTATLTAIESYYGFSCCSDGTAWVEQLPDDATIEHAWKAYATDAGQGDGADLIWFAARIGVDMRQVVRAAIAIIDKAIALMQFVPSEYDPSLPWVDYSIGFAFLDEARRWASGEVADDMAMLAAAAKLEPYEYGDAEDVEDQWVVDTIKDLRSAVEQDYERDRDVAANYVHALADAIDTELDASICTDVVRAAIPWSSIEPWVAVAERRGEEK
jgi:hypothetical protein